MVYKATSLMRRNGAAFLIGSQRDNYSDLPYAEFTITTMVNGQTVYLPFVQSTMSVNIEWGDGQESDSVLYTDNAHTYAIAGTYTLILTGTYVFPSDIPFTEAVQLANLFYNTGGPSWILKTNWFTAATASTWHGLTISDGRVTRIDINTNNMVGSIATFKLDIFTGLQDLSLYSNPSLTGNISSLILVSTLQIFKVNSTGVTGSMATWVLPVGLQIFYINNTALTGTPILLNNIALADYRCNDCSFTQANVDATLLAIYNRRVSFTYATPTLNIGGTNATPSGTYAYSATPTTGMQYLWALERQANINRWTCTITELASIPCSHTLGNPLATPEQITITSGWTAARGQRLLAKAPKDANFITNPTFSGVWTGGPTAQIPPDWANENEDEGTDFSSKETSDLPTGFTTGANLNTVGAAIEGITYNNISLAANCYYYISEWIKTISGSSYALSLVSQTHVPQSISLVAISTIIGWTLYHNVARVVTSQVNFRRRHISVGTGATQRIITNSVVQRTYGFPCELTSTLGVTYNGTAFWVTDAGKLMVDSIDGAAAGQTINSIRIIT